MKYLKFIPLFFFLVIALGSCVTPKEVDYLQDLSPLNTIPLNSKFEAVIAPYDELNIRVLGMGDEKELAEPFNPSGNAQNMNYTQNSGYLVDVNGDIQFPIFGKMHVKGLTRLQLQDSITHRLIAEGHMNNPLVDVRFSNFRVFVLGTNDGGKVLNISNERCTFIEALAMAGGLNKFTKRDRVAVMREVDGEMVTHFLDPRSSEVFDDPFFLLQQNDVIITQSFRRTYTQEAFNLALGIISATASLISSMSFIYLVFIGKQ